MSVVDVDRTKAWTKEMGFAILSILGLGEDELRKMMPPEAYDEFMEWEQINREKQTNNL